MKKLPVQMQNMLKKSAMASLWMLPIISMAAVFWLFYSGYIPLKGANLEEKGQFGDSFGVLNSLFTGLGFGGLVVTLLLQQKQIKQQEKELNIQRARRLG